MRALVRKMCAACGETLVETLVAVLVCGLAATLLMSTIGTASALNQSARVDARQQQAQENNAARFSGYWEDGENVSSSTGEVTFVDKDDPSQSETIGGAGNVSVFGGSIVVSYRIEVGDG